MRHLIDRHATDIVGCCETVLEQAWNANWRADSRCRTIYYGAEVEELDRRDERLIVRTELRVPAEAPMFLHLGRRSPDGQKTINSWRPISAACVRSHPACLS
jgi:hypothetical protein